MPKQKLTSLEVRVGHPDIWVTAVGDEGARVDVAQIRRVSGTNVHLELDEIREKFNEEAPETAAPKSVDMSAKKAIAKIEAGEPIDVDGDDRVTVLAAIEAAAGEASDAENAADTEGEK